MLFDGFVVVLRVEAVAVVTAAGMDTHPERAGPGVGEVGKSAVFPLFVLLSCCRYAGIIARKGQADVDDFLPPCQFRGFGGGVADVHGQQDVAGVRPRPHDREAAGAGEPAPGTESTSPLEAAGRSRAPKTSPRMQYRPSATNTRSVPPGA